MHRVLLVPEHVPRSRGDHEDNKKNFAGPRFFLRYAELDMHPLLISTVREVTKEQAGLHHRRITEADTPSPTRSFIGMIALSVMWMPSGQTSVQHLVMLQ